MNDMQTIQDDIGEWGKRTFSHDFESRLGVLSHLEKEVDELKDAVIHPDFEGVAEECADVFILMCSLATLFKFSLAREVEKKMEINRSRKWETPDDKRSSNLSHG